jgi:hypothetical protein
MSRRANRLEWVEINAAMRMQMTCWWKKKRARNDDDDDDVENQQFSSSNGTYTHVNGKEKEEISVMGGKKRRFANGGEVVVGW